MKFTVTAAFAIIFSSGIFLMTSCTSEKHHEDYRATLPDTIKFRLSHDEDHEFWPVAVSYIEQNVKSNKQTAGVRTNEVWVDPLAENKGHQVYMRRTTTRDYVDYEMMWKLNGSIQNMDLIKKKIERKASN